MYFGDFRRIVERHTLPYTCIKFHKMRFGPSDTCTIMDYSQHKWEPYLDTGHAQEDLYRDAVVFKVTYLRGEIPMEDSIGEWDEVNTRWKESPVVGVRKALKMLHKFGKIKWSQELQLLVGSYYVPSDIVCTKYIQ